MSKRPYDEDLMADARGRLLKALGGHIRTARKQRHMTQESLAEKAGISAKYLTELEAGRRNISIMLTLRLMQALEMDESAFFRFLPTSRPESKTKALINEFKDSLAKGQVRVALLALSDE